MTTLSGVLENDHVKMSDPKAVSEKILKIRNDGKERLQLMFDFDKTITKHVQSNDIHSLNVLQFLPGVPESFVEDVMIVQRTSYLAVDPRRSPEEQLELTDKAISDFLKLLKQLPSFDKSSIEDVAKKGVMPLRERAQKTLSLLRTNDVPVLIFSGGIGEVIEAVLKTNQVDLEHENIHIVANYLTSSDGSINDKRDERFIHFYNKNLSILEGTPYFEKISRRCNVILVGDSAGDATIAEKGPVFSNILKIGFLNAKVEQYLDSYLKCFDIVIVLDDTMDVLNALLQYLQIN